MLSRTMMSLSLLLAFVIPSSAVLTIQTVSPLYNGSISDTYDLQFLATGGTGTYSWTVVLGTLPAGLTLNTSGLLSGTPSATGFKSFTVQVMDSASNTQQKSFGLSVLVSDNRYCKAGNAVVFAGATTDGVAMLPQSCYYTLRSATPSPGAICAAHTTSDLTGILAGTLICSDNLHLACGDTIQLDAGASYPTSVKFTFPALGCDDKHYITVKSTGVRDARWAAEGARISPCYANLASLPGRPPYTCPPGGQAALMAQLIFTATLGSGPVDLATNNAHHYRFIGVEITRQSALGTTIADLVTLGLGHHVILDQVWCHGVPGEGTFPQSRATFTETGRCLALDQSNHVAVVNSYLNDFYCTSNVGTSCDAQAIAGGTGTALNTGWGTYKIVNNFMEGAAETVEVGGGPGPNTGGTIDSPTDFEVRRNHMFKPMQWMPAAQPISGWPVVKNLYEHKNGQRVLVEGNILENVWGGFSQVGAIVLMTPKSQANGTSSVCPYCVVTDITFRYNSGTKGAQAFQLASVANGNGAFALQGHNYSFHDNVMDNLAYQNCFGCAANPIAFFEAPAVPSSMVLHDVSLDHNTIVQAGSQTNQTALMELSGAMLTGNHMSNITFTNNVGEAGNYGTINAIGGGDTTNCAYGQTGGTNMINACWSPYVFGGNAIVANTVSWPVMPLMNAPNCLGVANFSSIFVNYNNGSGGDYHLISCQGKATDGSDPGAHIDLEASYTASVQ